MLVVRRSKSGDMRGLTRAAALCAISAGCTEAFVTRHGALPLNGARGAPARQRGPKMRYIDFRYTTPRPPCTSSSTVRPQQLAALLGRGVPPALFGRGVPPPPLVRGCAAAVLPLHPKVICGAHACTHMRPPARPHA